MVRIKFDIIYINIYNIYETGDKNHINYNMKFTAFENR